jgi:hypothetical protein
MRKLFLIMALIAAMLTGCGIDPIGPIIQLGVFWMNREAQKYYNTPQDDLYNATRNALNELEFPVEDVVTSDEKIVIKADANDRFKITLHEVRHNVTKVSILVNTLGDKPYAEMIYRHIDSQPDVIQFATLEELNTAIKERSRPRRE